MASYSAHIDTFANDNLPPREEWPELVFELPELQYPERLNAARVLLDEVAEGEVGDRPCIRTDDGVRSYRDLLEKANRIARVLTEDMGLVPGNRVLLRAANTPMLIAAWFGVLKAGGVVVTTMPLLRANELASIIDKARISHALTDARLVEELESARDSQPVLSNVMTFGPGGELEERMEDKPSSFETVDTAAEDVALIAPTSGTTGDPKGCMHFHRDVLAVCDTFARHVLDPQPDEIFTGTPPLGFTFGLGGLVLFPMRFGASILPIEQPGPASLLEAIETHRATTVFTAPTAFRALLNMGDEADLFSSLRKCVSAGEPLPRATSDAWFERTGVRIIDGIGSTEMLHIFISAAGDDIRPGSTGKPVPGYQAMIADDSMQPLPPGEVGRLAVRGPTGCRYLADPRQAEYVIDGWNVTGDSYEVDEDGYFWFQARTDDMILSAGYNIPGPEVEAVLMEHDSVGECAVVAAPDEERGQIAKAFVVPREEATGSAGLSEELQDFVKSRLAPYKYPREIEFIDVLPKTSTGKIQRFKLRERELERSDAQERILSTLLPILEGRKMQILQPPGWAKPKGYANGVAAEGRLVFVAGQVGWDETEAFRAQDFVGQVRQCLKNTLAVLAEAGAGPEHVVRMTWYITDREEYTNNLESMGQVYRESMGRHFPAMTMVEVAALIESEARVEVETTAVVPVEPG